MTSEIIFIVLLVNVTGIGILYFNYLLFKIDNMDGRGCG